MAFVFGIIELSSITGTDPLSGSISDDTATVGSTVGDVLSFSSAADVQAQTADGDYPDDDGALLTAAVTLNGVTYPSGAVIEADWEIITVDPDTGHYFRITGLYIGNSPVGVAISRAWDAGTGNYIGGAAGVYQPGTDLVHIDGDDLDGTPNIGNFATDTGYATYGSQHGIGNDAHLTDSNGVMLCFAAGTLIETVRGAAPVETLDIGDLVITVDSGPQPLRYLGRHILSGEDLAARPRLRPVRIRAGALGRGLPSSDLLVSPQHRILLRSRIAERMFGSPEVLVAAHHLRRQRGVTSMHPDGVDYFHLLLDRHELVLANGTPAESLLLAARTLQGLPVGPCPDIGGLASGRERDARASVRPLVIGARVRSLLRRHRRNRQELICSGFRPAAI
ncbi:Hint domain-containing protein [Salipiger mangrovisoli]|uniref:Hint domain-containing protein n=1 Tax=Salipiger mangrovisoli TaxID=2865933 RepID=A0ABR9WZB0_9RHOB|nr:Hint domain-containing protein [Salipiger mangrovisoli]MBE9636581.1 Hint domain-containing protein [Salipiger mangrovisoli]